MSIYYGTGLENPEVATDNLEEQGLNNQTIITKEDIQEAAVILNKYKQGKANLEQRIVNDELWWELRHWEAIGKKKQKDYESPKATSAWLFNAILNKHADFMDNFPEPVVLPREESDRQTAKDLSQILPVIMEYNNFEQTYSDNNWEKLKHGTAVYGVFWDPEKENGLGDIDIHEVDLLKIFWEPGITDIQESQNLFIVDLVDQDILNERYPEYKGQMNGNIVDITQYIYDDTIDSSNKSVVVDWYYKKKMPNGTTVVQFVKFVNDILLYASENDPKYQMTGYYNHGKYPVDFDCLFPEKDTPVGFGYVAISKDPQIFIDQLSSNILENAMMNTKKRFFMSESTNVNEEEFNDWTKPIVHVAGEVSDNRIQEIKTEPLSSVYLNVLQMKIEELKDTAANRDVNSGGAGSGVTAAAAIAALQEAGNKASRDMIGASYRSYVNIVNLCIELIRQFYDQSRSFRITAPNGEDGFAFTNFSNAKLTDQPIMDMNGNPMIDSYGNALVRKPIFDLKIKAQKQNPFSRMEQNEYAKEFYAMGMFNPDQAQAAMIALDMMNFEGIEEVKMKVSQGQTLYKMLEQTLAQLQMITGASLNNAQQTQKVSQEQAKPMEQPAEMTSYGQALAERSKPSMDNLGTGASK